MSIVKEFDPDYRSSALTRAITKAQESLHRQWSEPIQTRVKRVAETAERRSQGDKTGGVNKPHHYWETFEKTLAYACYAAKNKAIDERKKIQTGGETQQTQLPEDYSLVDATDLPPQEVVIAQEHEELENRLLAQVWSIFCQIGELLEAESDPRTARWFWLVMGGIGHTEKCQPPRDQIPPGDTTAWLHQPELVRRELSERNAVRNVLTRPINRVIKVLPGQIVALKEYPTENQWKNIGWKLLVWMGRVTAEGVIDGSIRTDLPADPSVLPKVGADGAVPTREQVASWSKLIVGGK